MPLYEYVCKNCNHEFEVLQSFSDDPIKVCESCGKEEVVKKISRTTFSLKGGGWYKDHYGLKSSSGGESKSDGGGSSTPKSSD